MILLSTHILQSQAAFHLTRTEAMMLQTHLIIEPLISHSSSFCRGDRGSTGYLSMFRPSPNEVNIGNEVECIHAVRNSPYTYHIVLLWMADICEQNGVIQNHLHDPILPRRIG